MQYSRKRETKTNALVKILKDNFVFCQPVPRSAAESESRFPLPEYNEPILVEGGER